MQKQYWICVQTHTNTSQCKNTDHHTGCTRTHACNDGKATIATANTKHCANTCDKKDTNQQQTEDAEVPVHDQGVRATQTTQKRTSGHTTGAKD